MGCSVLFPEPCDSPVFVLILPRLLSISPLFRCRALLLRDHTTAPRTAVGDGRLVYSQGLHVVLSLAAFDWPKVLSGHRHVRCRGAAMSRWLPGPNQYW